MIQPSLLLGWPQRSMDEPMMQVNSVPWQLTSHTGDPCAGIVEPFKHLLRVTTDPQIMVFELRAPMGACPGQHGISTLFHPNIVVLSIPAHTSDDYFSLAKKHPPNFLYRVKVCLNECPPRSFSPQAKYDMGALLWLNTEVLERALIIFGGIVQCKVVWPWVLFRETMVYI